ncbi:coiled-coil domain-containing protein 42 homolog isoform X2 [Esox lucius]|uniref:coiled-coil domain-containing protein 42 homolog isoform X2 n=1 Tax=Esox lucius TaxID=8010 RepID=UPI00147685C5|nr:coiled-coil domain-containing protein 42 homolog isoform X2 [Esox lucius]
METLPFINNDDPRLNLKVENRMKNIFVTQFLETRDEEENVNHIPVITETASRVLETGVNTLQRTLVLKKQVEVDEVDRQLAKKQQEFKVHMHALAQRRAELELKQQAMNDRAKKFEKFVEDNEVKRHRSLRKYQAARKHNDLKQKEKEQLTEQLEKLQTRQQYLKDRVTKYKMYEDYMMNILDFLPENYLEYGADSLVMPIIRRHETLSLTHQDLVERLGQLVGELEQGQRSLESLKQEHNTNKLMMNRQLSELQTQWDRAKEKNKQTEMNLLMHQGQSRDQVEEVGSLLIAVKNLAEQCYLQHYGPLEKIDMLTMMDMEYILERTDIEKRATQLIESGSTLTSATQHRRSLNINTKTQVKSISKTSGSCGLSS